MQGIRTANTQHQQIPRQNHPGPRQPRIPPNHTSLRLLRGMPAEIRQRLCLEVLLPGLRLPRPSRHHRRQSALRPRWSVSRNPNPRPDPRRGSRARNPARRCLLRSRLVRSGRRRHMGRLATRRRLAFWRQGFFRSKFSQDPPLLACAVHTNIIFPVQPRQQPATHRARPPARQRGLQVPLPVARGRHRLVGAQLLLPLRQRRVYHDARRGPRARFQDLLRRAGSQARCARGQERRGRVFLVGKKRSCLRSKVSALAV